jgi:hypothetical protein
LSGSALAWFFCDARSGTDLASQWRPSPTATAERARNPRHASAAMGCRTLGKTWPHQALHPYSLDIPHLPPKATFWAPYHGRVAQRTLITPRLTQVLQLSGSWPGIHGGKATSESGTTRKVFRVASNLSAIWRTRDRHGSGPSAPVECPPLTTPCGHGSRVAIAAQQLRGRDVAAAQ